MSCHQPLWKTENLEQKQINGGVYMGVRQGGNFLLKQRSRVTENQSDNKEFKLMCGVVDNPSMIVTCKPGVGIVVKVAGLGS